MDPYIGKIKKYLLQDGLFEPFNFKSDLSVTFLAQGEYNKNYTVIQNNNKYVFRINMDSQMGLSNQIEYEHDALKLLEVSGVTPKVYFYDDDRIFFDEGILLMEFLEGRPLDYKQDLKKAAEIFAKIHQINPKKFEEKLIIEKDLCAARIIEADKWLIDFRKSDKPSGETKLLMESLYNYCLKVVKETDDYFNDHPWAVVNNTEVNSHNFIIGTDNSYLIDWEKPVISDPVQDITQFLAPTTTLWKTDDILSEDQLNEFYKTYEALVKKPVRQRVKKYEPFLFLRAFSWCAGAWMTYTDTSRSIQNADTLKTIEQYLLPNFMKEVLKEYIKKEQK